MSKFKSFIGSHQAFFALSILFSSLIILSNDSNITYYFKYFIRPISVFLHEASHGIAALISGFEIIELKMRWLSGHVISVHPEDAYLRAAFVSFAGYAGTTVFGFLMFLASIKHRGLFMSLMVLNAVFFTIFFRDIETIAVMTYVITVFLLCTRKLKVIDYILRFCAAYIMTTSVISPTYQLHISGHSDSVNLQKLLPLPEVVWVGIWMSFSIGFIFYAFKILKALDRPD